MKELQEGLRGKKFLGKIPEVGFPPGRRRSFTVCIFGRDWRDIRVSSE
jgi:hypothetical protein